MKTLFTFILCLAMAGFVFAASNSATISTTGSGNTASASQTGSSNAATIEQIANTSTATQIQDGSGNVADLDQKGGWPAGSTVVGETGAQEQHGNNNQATLWQLADGGNGGNTGTQYQEGNTNKVTAWQHTVSSTVDQDQIGNSNEANSYQTGFNGYVRQVQDGTANIAVVDEQGGGGWVVGNTAIETQTGRWNTATIVQYGTGGAKNAQGNYAEVTQTGDDNKTGKGLFSNHDFGIYQAGNYNTASVTQNLNVNKSDVDQLGDSNTASVVQNGGTGLFGDYGDFVNKATVMQNGTGNNATVNQTYP
ncbi:MAG TPA: hypothetical protein PLP19_16810 [bacterium]|nr:hypothetical protein [bacterium]HPN45155.1 hypothetical protein [bacterium]